MEACWVTRRSILSGLRIGRERATRWRRHGSINGMPFVTRKPEQGQPLRRQMARGNHCNDCGDLRETEFPFRGRKPRVQCVRNLRNAPSRGDHVSERICYISGHHSRKMGSIKFFNSISSYLSPQHLCSTSPDHLISRISEHT